MTVRTTTLVKNEIRMLWNQFKQTLTTPSMLMFYMITIFGALFISLVLSVMANFAPLFADVGESMEGLLDRPTVFQTVALLSISSVIIGYFGIGPASVLNNPDEHIMMPGPVMPHQLFMSRYITRIVRKSGYFILALLILLPLIISAGILVLPILTLVLVLIVFLEVNYFIGGIAAFLRIKIGNRTNRRIRHLILPVLALALYIPAMPEFTWHPLAAVLPSNAMTIVITEITGILAVGYGPLLGYVCFLVLFPIFFLIMANLCGYEFYEEFSSAMSREGNESRISQAMRGDLDFSSTRFNDPMFWIILKDFWSKMRSPLQFWKYVYVVIGTVMAIWLNIAQPIWLSPIPIPPQFGYSAEPAFLLLMIMLIQVGGLMALLGFTDEKENIYLLKTSPFRSRDIVLAKYLLSVFEVGVGSLPILGFLLYFFRVTGSFFLISLAAPMVLIFCATGVMIGAYVPVFTNEPKTPPVPLAFSFPAINLTLGGVLIWIVGSLSDSDLVIIYLPIFTTIAVMFFLLLAINALGSYK